MCRNISHWYFFPPRCGCHKLRPFLLKSQSQPHPFCFSHSWFVVRALLYLSQSWAWFSLKTRLRSENWNWLRPLRVAIRLQPPSCFNETNPRKSKTHSTGGITGLFHNPPTKATKDHFCIFPLASQRLLQIALNGHPSDFHFHSRSLNNGTESDNLVHIITFFSLWWCHSEHFGAAALWWQVAPALLRLGWAGSWCRLLVPAPATPPEKKKAHRH